MQGRLTRLLSVSPSLPVCSQTRHQARGAWGVRTHRVYVLQKHGASERSPLRQGTLWVFVWLSWSKETLAHTVCSDWEVFVYQTVFASNKHRVLVGLWSIATGSASWLLPLLREIWWLFLFGLAARSGRHFLWRCSSGWHLSWGHCLDSWELEGTPCQVDGCPWKIEQLLFMLWLVILMGFWPLESAWKTKLCRLASGSSTLLVPLSLCSCSTPCAVTGDLNSFHTCSWDCSWVELHFAWSSSFVAQSFAHSD